MEEKDKKEYEEVISSYYGGDQVAALVTFKIDTKGSDQVAQKIASFPNIEDVFLVRGDTDIIAKARFPNYAALKVIAMRPQLFDEQEAEDQQPCECTD